MAKKTYDLLFKVKAILKPTPPSKSIKEINIMFFSASPHRRLWGGENLHSFQVIIVLRNEDQILNKTSQELRMLSSVSWIVFSIVKIAKVIV